MDVDPEFKMSVATKARGEVLEGVAFQFCKIATVALILQRWTLPVAAALAAGLYVWAYASGKKDTRCILGHPLLIASFWGIVSAGAFWVMFDPGLVGRLLHKT